MLTGGEVQPSASLDLALVVLVAALATFAVAAARRAAARSDAGGTLGGRACAAFPYGLAAWLLATAAIGASGWLANTDARPPRMMLLMAPTALLTLASAASPLGARLARGLPIAALVGFQAFRIPVELLLHAAHAQGVLPVQMTYLGSNFDVVSGLLALPVAWVATRPPSRVRLAVLLAWNVLGLALLANIVVIAVLSMPGPFHHYTEGPPNTIVFHWPWIWLPTVLVQAALFGHVLVFRALARRDA